MASSRRRRAHDTDLPPTERQPPRHQDWIDSLVAKRDQVDELVTDSGSLLRMLGKWVSEDLASWDHADAIPRLAYVRWVLTGLLALESACIDDTPDELYRIHILERRSAATGGEPPPAGGGAPVVVKGAAKARARRRRPGKRGRHA